MNKQKIIVIAFLMGIALIGLVILQVNWIRHDLKIREEKFTQQAIDAVNKAINKMETRETVQFISHEMEGLLDDSLTGYFKTLPVPPMPAIPPAPAVIFNADSMNAPQSFTFISESDSPTSKNRVRVVANTNVNDGKVTVSVNSSSTGSNEQIQISNELELAEHELSRANFEKKLNRELATQSQQLKREHDKVKRRVKSLNKVIEKMAVEYERRDFSLMRRISPELLDSLVSSELKNNGINFPYSIQFNGGEKDNVIWKRTDTVSNASGNKSVTVNLFPEDIVNRNDSVTITFADTMFHFISSMWMMLLSSILFTGIVIFAFSYTIMVIFRQKKLSEIKNDFINNMTHEFKTPIATIRLASEAINNPEVIRDIEKVKYYTGIIKDENERMNGHVENILQMAQFDKNAFAPELETVDMHEVIGDTILMMQLHAEQKGGQIIFKHDAQNSIVNADRRYIPLVILNLLDNAIKYSEEKPEVIVSTSNDGELFQVSIQDNGIGMSNDRQKRIFEKFYRVTTGNLHNVKGFGLGLSYVKAIVTAHNGEISVQSEPGKGTCMTVKLPLKK